MGEDAIQQTIKDIRNRENSIYNDLNQSSTSEQEPEEQKLNTLTSLSKERNSFLDELTNNYDTLYNTFNEKKMDIQELTNAVENKQRMLEINTYFGKQYVAHSGVVMLLIITFVAMFFVALLRNLGLLNKDIANVLVAIIIIVGAVIVFFRISDLSARNNMDYDKYDWPAMKTDGKPLKEYVPPPVSVGGESSENDLETCVGEKCCGEGTTYDKEKNTCISNTNIDGDTFSLMNRNASHNVAPFSKEHNCAGV